MRLLIVNPNTSGSFTEKIRVVSDQYKLPTTEIVAVTAASGPRSIESIYDEILSAPGTLETALKHIDSCDAVIFACYSDHPVIYGMREITEKPVLGIAEASMYLACMVGNQFSVVTTNREWEPLLWEAVRHYGLTERCVSVRSTGMEVLALESAKPEETYQRILEAARDAMEIDGAEVICLGCAGMTGLDKDLEKELGIPVIDGVVAAIKLMEGMVGYGLKTSKRLTYSRPGYKELVGMSKKFENAYRQ